ncbi:Multicopper oxidase type 3 [Penicillium cosmopolitanum]|uniref:laccase n=1 Tax=Penicillium cosmopolitanum TaxID=1131564 RepID=A0A9X0B4W4_9EURO|nr:Multicopper oxidase type 3 [Penicillium cosmopolitanum]KAJ5388161.1 Multicopper oxidase type 3 [Penicillium cosmopolitanum]
MRYFSFFVALVGVGSATSMHGRKNNPYWARHVSHRRDTCSGNSASDRQTWCNYDLSTNYYDVVPDTGVTREYYFDIQEVTVAPDGYSRTAMAVNGSIPGPTIQADWGDNVVVHVTNSLTSAKNGSSIHFHGIRQNYTNPNDGVVSITQCPTAPGKTTTYKWRATQYGSTWYHSHIGLQAWEGVFGGIIINGPASGNYDEDKGVLFLNDWTHQTVDEMYDSAQSNGPPTLDNGLINGTNVYGDDNSTSQTGYRFNTSFTADTSYRFRLVNAAVDTHFKFSIDNHTLTVIAMDLVPIEPFNTTVLSIAMGQRYDIVVNADQSTGNESFWMRAIPQSACSDNDSTNNIKGIVYYGSSPSTPTTSAYSYTDSCDDMDSSYLVPSLSQSASLPYYNASEPVTLGTNSENFFRWKMNATSMQVYWDNPTLLQIWNNNTSFTNTSGVVHLPRADEWSYVVIETTLAVPHPIHLHGHDFFILAQGIGTYSSSDITTLTNPPRRDTAILPSSGYLVVAFKTDNPGAWLMHCHIGWHTEEGFAIQFLERWEEARKLINYSTLNSTCENWTTYTTEATLEQDDDGI